VVEGPQNCRKCAATENRSDLKPITDVVADDDPVVTVIIVETKTSSIGQICHCLTAEEAEIQNPGKAKDLRQLEWNEEPRVEVQGVVGVNRAIDDHGG
jgi:hypothetical protein